MEPTQNLLSIGDGQRDSDAIRVESRLQSGRRGLADAVSERVDEVRGQRDFGNDEQLRHDQAPFATPLVRCKEHTAQLGEANGRIIEHSQDRLAVGDRKSNEILLGVEGDKEHIARVLKAGREQKPSQIGHVLFVDGTPASLTRTTLPGAEGRQTIPDLGGGCRPQPGSGPTPP